jgi:hypothetical protein
MGRRRENFFRNGKVVGLKTRPLGPGAVISKVGEVISDKRNEKLDERDRKEAIKRAERVEKATEELRVLRETGQSLVAMQAVKEAEKLHEIAEDTGEHGKEWREACRRAGIHPRTAENLLHLWTFYDEDKRTFEALASLGRTKLYQIARLEKEQRPTLRPKMIVEVDGQKKAVEDMTCAELTQHLRVVCPVGKRKRRTGLRKRVMESMDIARDARKMATYSRFELEFVTKKMQILLGKLTTTLKNTA